LPLTKRGEDQAYSVGQSLQKIIGGGEVRFYVSSLWRTRQTFLHIQKSFQNISYYEDPRLREQEWSTNLESTSEYRDILEEYRNNYGSFYYRFHNGGESCSDVFNRLSDFMNTLYRDFESSEFPDNVIIISHGMTMRVFLMRFFHCSVEEFESWRNPKNCQYYHLKLENEKYSLTTPLSIYKKSKHNYKFDWGNNTQFSTSKLPIINT